MQSRAERRRAEKAEKKLAKMADGIVERYWRYAWHFDASGLTITTTGRLPRFITRIEGV